MATGSTNRKPKALHTMAGTPGDRGLRKTIGHYVVQGPQDNPDLLLGPFTNEADAELFVDVGAVQLHLKQRTTFRVAQHVADQLTDLPLGTLNGYFPTGFWDPYREKSASVVWWRPSQQFEMIRWVAFGSDDDVVLGRGSFEHLEPEISNNDLLRAVRLADPLLLGRSLSVSEAHGPHGERDHGQPVLVQITPRRLTVGSLLQIRVGSEDVLSPVTYFRTVENSIFEVSTKWDDDHGMPRRRLELSPEVWVVDDTYRSYLSNRPLFSLEDKQDGTTFEESVSEAVSRASSKLSTPEEAELVKPADVLPPSAKRRTSARERAQTSNGDQLGIEF